MHVVYYSLVLWSSRKLNKVLLHFPLVYLMVLEKGEWFGCDGNEYCDFTISISVLANVRRNIGFTRYLLLLRVSVCMWYHKKWSQLLSEMVYLGQIAFKMSIFIKILAHRTMSWPLLRGIVWSFTLDVVIAPFYEMRMVCFLAPLIILRAKLSYFGLGRTTPMKRTWKRAANPGNGFNYNVQRSIPLVFPGQSYSIIECNDDNEGFDVWRKRRGLYATPEWI